ncbi:MFS transporter [Nocardioides sp. URHA0032]|uniref:MFS transporter n=1 Tax=Nocardioides sp. URHA0032 TaxID=1380388 RepID=UPI00055E0C24|nr:MFS transporter [Nocardioides sp. URHA0032]
MSTYRQLFGIPEFRVLFVNRCVVMLSVAASGLALGTITYEATGSPVLTAMAMFGGPLVSLVASQLLLASSDSVRPRTALLWQMAAPMVANALQAVPGVPWQGRFVLLAIPYVVNAMFSGTQWVVVRDVVPEGSYVLARSALNLAVGGMQVVGYGLGGLALLWLSPRDLFLVAAVADAVCLVNLRLGLRDRPARGTGGGSVVRRTARVNRLLLGSVVTRPLYVAMWVPNGLVVGAEALYVPYGHGSTAGYLFAAAAAGMMLGDLVVGRFVPHHLRDRLIGPLRITLAAPYLLLLLSPPAGVTVVVAFVASVGYAASLPLQERLFARTDDAVHGQAMGLYGTGLMVWQAIGALLGGLAATRVSPAHAMGLMALASVAVTVANTPGLRRSAPDPAAADEVSASGSPSS